MLYDYPDADVIFCGIDLPLKLYYISSSTVTNEQLFCFRENIITRCVVRPENEFSSDIYTKKCMWHYVFRR